jgi:LuxR family maltose regulon positive regulatory protein
MVAAYGSEAEGALVEVEDPRATGVAAAGEQPRALPLVRTKLHAPVARELVSRRELLDLLSVGGPHCRLTLIRAPAGWGKSTLLANWHSSERETRPFAWLALDGADNDQPRFWLYVTEALSALEPEIGRTSLMLLRAPGVGVVDEVLPVLINELGSLTHPAVLVLDDYHLITNPEIHEGLAFLLEHLPARLHLVLSTRSVPPLPLARLRARGQLVEVDAELLRFSAAEADALLNDLHRLALDRSSVLRLCERTEGWPAGLYLAALSLRGRDDARAFVEAFAGDDRHVVDYLSVEVLAGQRDGVRSFLLRTSILERLCPPLCDVVTGFGGSASTLDEVARSNLFLVPLDTKREWYRYHHLFGELLRHELMLVEPELVPELHRRAASWLLDAGLVSEGVHHTIAAGDVADASKLILRHWLDLRDQHRLETVLRWLDALPPQAVPDDARLCLVRASTLLEVGRIGEVDEWLDAAERGSTSDALLAGPASVDSGVAAYRAITHYVLGDVGRIRRTAKPALEVEETGSAYWRSALLTIFGASVFLEGRSSAAVAPLEEAVRLSEQSGHALALTHALGWSAVVHADLGEWQRADAVLDDVEALLGERPELREYFGTALVHVVRAKLLARRGRPTEADAAMARATELARRGVSRLQIAYALLAHAEVKHQLRDRDAAVDLLREAEAAVAACPDPGMLRQLATRVERLLEPAHRGRAPGAPFVEELSKRELAVLQLFPTGLSQREIGASLYVSVNTVKTHTKSIFRKLDVSSRRDAVERARALGLL